MKAAVYYKTNNTLKAGSVQESEMQEYCKTKKYDVIRVYHDSVSVGSNCHPAYDQMMQDKTKGHFDVIVFIAHYVE